MIIRSISDAKKQFSDLVQMAENGEEIVIARAGKPLACLVGFAQPRRSRKLGALKGQIQINDDFDASAPSIEELFLGANE